MVSESAHEKNLREPLIQRATVFNFLPQEPAWFCNIGHHRARARYRQKLRTEYELELLAECPACGGKEMSLIATQERHGLPVSVALCENCTLLFNALRPDAAALNDHYRRDYREIERGVVANLHEFMFDLQQSKGPDIWAFINEHSGGKASSKPLHIAEIGCGEGGIIGWLAKNIADAKVTGFELNEKAVSYGKSIGLNLRGELFRGDQAFDVIILEQVLEHVADVSGFLDVVSRSQKLGDLLYVGVPGIFDADAHYGSNFISYLEYGHLSHFCLYTLERALAPHGYELLRGDETIRALFRRTKTAPDTLSSAQVPARQMKDYLLQMEGKFRKKPSHLLRNWRPYTKYALTYLLSIL